MRHECPREITWSKCSEAGNNSEHVKHKLSCCVGSQGREADEWKVRKGARSCFVLGAR